MRVLGFVAMYSLACGSDPPAPGLVGVVTGGTKLTDVELFVGTTQADAKGGCRGKSGIGPRDPNNNPGRCFPGSGWTDTSTTSTFEPATGNVTWFQFASTGQSIPALLAVGYDSGTPVAAAIVHDLPVGATPVEIVLAPISDLLAAGNGVTVWRRPGDDGVNAKSACAALGSDAGVEFFVPGDDTDCDGVSQDCPGNGFNWCFSGTPQGSGAFSCLAQPGGPGNACRIAGVACGEGQPCPATSVQPGTCVPTNNFTGCVPTQFCEGGHDPTSGGTVAGCSTLDSSCFTIAKFASLIHVECTFEVQVDANGALIACNDTQALPNPLAFLTPSAILGQDTCMDVSLLDLTGQLDRVDHVNVPTAQLPTNASAQFSLADSGCTNGVVYEGDSFPQIAIDGTDVAFAALDVHTASDQHRIVPLAVKFTGCNGSGTNTSACAIVPDPASGVTMPCP